jgi:hypothetical protein
VPNFKDEAVKIRVHDLTGCIPILLRPFLGQDGQDYDSVKDKIWNNTDLTAVAKNIRAFASRMLVEMGTDYDQ